MRHSRQSVTKAIALVAAVSVLVIPPRALYAQVEIVPVVRGGDPAPGAGAGVTFSTGNFLDLQINGDGTVLFGGGLLGVGVTQQNRSGIWIGRPGDLSLAIRTGDAAPEAGVDATFAFLGKPVLGADASAAFYARVRGTGISEDAGNPGNDDTLWGIEPPGAQQLVLSSRLESNRVARERLSPLAIAGSVIAPFLFLWFYEYDADLLLVVFTILLVITALLSGDSSSIANTGPQADAETTEIGVVNLVPDGSASLLAATGNDAPSLAEKLLSITRTSVVVSADRLAFIGSIAGGQAIWLGAPDALAAVVLPNGEVPQTLAAVFGDGATYSVGGVSLSLNAAGELAFIANVASGSSTVTALIAGPPDAPRLVAQVLPSGSTEEGFTQLGDVVLNAEADVAFIASHTTLGGIPGLVRGLWVTSGHADPVLALGEGQTAPGLQQGEVVSFLEEGPFMNERGQVAMRAGIGSAAGFENTTDRGIWLVDPVAGTQLVARSGASMDVGDAERLLDNVSLITSHPALRSGGEDGRPSVLNDLGELIFQAHWQEPGVGEFRSGIFIAAGACGALTCRDVDVLCKSCGQPVGQGPSPTASDALGVLRVAVGTSSCTECVCDVDGSGSVAATDALITLKKAVGQDVTLACPA